MRCDRCSADIVVAPGSGATGYAVVSETGARICYACCAVIDRAEMLAHGVAALYLVREPSGARYVTNWPGTLRFPVGDVRTSRHGGGFGAQRTDAWFVGPDGARWHAINRGDSQIARCRRLRGAK